MTDRMRSREYVLRSVIRLGRNNGEKTVFIKNEFVVLVAKLSVDDGFSLVEVLRIIWSIRLDPFSSSFQLEDNNTK
jgi:hypothetical protein